MLQQVLRQAIKQLRTDASCRSEDMTGTENPRAGSESTYGLPNMFGQMPQVVMQRMASFLSPLTLSLGFTNRVTRNTRFWPSDGEDDIARAQNLVTVWCPRHDMNYQVRITTSLHSWTVSVRCTHTHTLACQLTYQWLPGLQAFQDHG